MGVNGWELNFCSDSQVLEIFQKVVRWPYIAYSYVRYSNIIIFRNDYLGQKIIRFSTIDRFVAFPFKTWLKHLWNGDNHRSCTCCSPNNRIVRGRTRVDMLAQQKCLKLKKIRFKKMFKPKITRTRSIELAAFIYSPLL